MSGGDGRGPGNSGLGHNGGQSSGNVNGSAGSGGPSSGGGSDPNSGPGWGTTHTPNGDIHNYNPGEFGGGGNQPGGNGGNSGNNGGSSGNGQSSVTAMAFGLPALAAPGADGLAFALSGDAVSAAMTEVMGLLKGPFKFGLWGVAFYGVLPTEIAKDDPKMMSKIVTSLPADTVTETPASTLPLAQATVSVKRRVVDVVKDERQHIAVVAGLPMSVPVVDAKPTKRPGVFSVSVPGLPDLNVSVTKGTPVAKTPPKGLSAEKGDSRPAGFTAGSNSHEAVIRFPKETGQKPVYVSVTDVLTPAQVKQRQEEEKRRQQAWDAAHPEEGLKREYDKAKAELDAEDKNIATLNGRITSTEKAIPSARTAVQEADKKVKEAEANKDDFVTYNPPHEYGSGWQDQVRYLDKDIQNQNEKLKSAQASLNAMNDSLSRDKAALPGAMESRKQKEKKTKDAENKLNEEKKKPRKGTKDYGHDYFPDPKTEDIKGLGELKEGKPKTPKQGGGGKRARWYGDKKRKIYEWDSQHGELEGYRASDGEHLGAFDPKTGKQVKGPDPKRNIKNYL
ncbi:colicin-like bacteriocin tRNase domain-containing protein [Klebsiella grimontii]|uniref:colicin-like bacteriocin tRNase domain-containing protein n=1 Tax=Klebsiella grimontii TaxID=2058152 RepID=UPI001CF681CC|nr:colicin-like bacteriocin tRNase domain-containing protein [Klebsiella grimontii]MCB3528659.1 cloacin [Klebsiella grimontii]